MFSMQNRAGDCEKQSKYTESIVQCTIKTCSGISPGPHHCFAAWYPLGTLIPCNTMCLNSSLTWSLKSTLKGATFRCGWTVPCMVNCVNNDTHATYLCYGNNDTHVTFPTWKAAVLNISWVIANCLPLALQKMLSSLFPVGDCGTGWCEIVVITRFTRIMTA